MRLIDADAMNEELFYKQVGGKDSLITAESAFEMISVQPTTYDVDKVVEQLEELRKECEDPLQDYDPNYFIGKAIEIAKAGGNS